MAKPLAFKAPSDPKPPTMAELRKLSLLLRTIDANRLQGKLERPQLFKMCADLNISNDKVYCLIGIFGSIEQCVEELRTNPLFQQPLEMTHQESLITLSMDRINELLTSDIPLTSDDIKLIKTLSEVIINLSKQPPTTNTQTNNFINNKVAFTPSTLKDLGFEDQMIAKIEPAKVKPKLLEPAKPKAKSKRKA